MLGTLQTDHFKGAMIFEALIFLLYFLFTIKALLNFEALSGGVLTSTFITQIEKAWKGASSKFKRERVGFSLLSGGPCPVWGRGKGV